MYFVDSIIVLTPQGGKKQIVVLALEFSSSVELVLFSLVSFPTLEVSLNPS